jgi:hypothetical protein
VHYWRRKIFDRCIARHRHAITCGLSGQRCSVDCRVVQSRFRHCYSIARHVPSIEHDANGEIVVRRRRLPSSHRQVRRSRPSTPQDGRREIFSKRLLLGPEQRFPQRVVVGEIDAILDMTDGEMTDRR